MLWLIGCSRRHLKGKLHCRRHQHYQQIPVLDPIPKISRIKLCYPHFESSDCRINIFPTNLVLKNWQNFILKRYSCDMEKYFKCTNCRGIIWGHPHTNVACFHAYVGSTLGPRWALGFGASYQKVRIQLFCIESNSTNLLFYATLWLEALGYWLW